MQHALRTAELLQAEGAHVGFILYQRDERISQPVVRERAVLDTYPAAAVSFNFRMDSALLTAAFRAASARVASAWSPRPGPRPLLYYQTPVLLPYAPPEYAIAVTHHSPFVENVKELLGPEATRRAFDWDHPKADHLSTMQAQAVEVVKARDSCLCLEISILQERFLGRRGVPERQVRRLPPPLGGEAPSGHLPEPVERLLAGSKPGPGRGRGLIALTAVSRLDYFKNAELYVTGCCLALRAGSLDIAVLVGGFPVDAERERLREMVPAELAHAFVFVPRLPRRLLVGSLFPRLAGRGIFVCSSRFDLVPYTALEAARAGLCTVVPDNGRVGAAEYLANEYRFSDSPAGLAALLEEFALDANALGRFDATADRIRQATSDEAFVRAFLEATSVPPRSSAGRATV